MPYRGRRTSIWSLDHVHARRQQMKWRQLSWREEGGNTCCALSQIGRTQSVKFLKNRAGSFSKVKNEKFVSRWRLNFFPPFQSKFEIEISLVWTQRSAVQHRLRRSTTQVTRLELNVWSFRLSFWLFRRLCILTNSLTPCILHWDIL